jgi:hypothetical protein
VSDLVVTVPKHLWQDWIEEGDAAEVEYLRAIGGAR